MVNFAISVETVQFYGFDYICCCCFCILSGNICVFFPFFLLLLLVLFLLLLLIECLNKNSTRFLNSTICAQLKIKKKKSKLEQKEKIKQSKQTNKVQIDCRVPLELPIIYKMDFFCGQNKLNKFI